MTELSNLNKYNIQLNYKMLCESICNGKVKDAYNEFVEKSSKLTDFSGIDMILAYRLALNNLNYSIYYYLLFAYDLQLTECCYSNTLIMHTKLTAENINKVAENIISSYYSELLDMKVLSKNPIIQEILEYIEEHISEPILIKNIAKKMHINSTYLSQLFKQSMGQSFSSYLAEHRIHHAKILLLQTNENIDRIGDLCGFSSPSYFSTVFTNKTGMSPGRYRRNHELSFGAKEKK